MWYERLYLHMHSAAVGQIGQQRGTFDDGLEEVDMAAMAYASGILLAHMDFVGSTCSLAPAPFPLLR
jgi:hypothetical protein